MDDLAVWQPPPPPRSLRAFSAFAQTGRDARLLETPRSCAQNAPAQEIRASTLNSKTLRIRIKAGLMLTNDVTIEKKKGFCRKFSVPMLWSVVFFYACDNIRVQWWQQCPVCVSVPLGDVMWIPANVMTLWYTDILVREDVIGVNWEG